MKVHVHKRNGKFLAAVDIHQGATVEEFKEAFYKQFHYYPERQRFTTKDPRGPVLKDGKLSDLGVEEGSVLYFKDLGVQISWRLVFVLEYLGPLIICPILYFLPHVIYGTPVQHTLSQRLGMYLMLGHFMKRELETLFIHRFSNATMPIYRLPVNCFHYWILCGLAIGYFLFHPKYQAPLSTPVTIALAILMVVFECLNFQTHLILRNLRPRGSKARGVPSGGGFDQVSCANYLWEILAWLCFSLISGCLTSYIFLAAAVGQMTQWALKKHHNYIKELPDYPRHRKALFPYIL